MENREAIALIEGMRHEYGLRDQEEWTANEQTKACEMAIAALGEIQGYRKLGSVEELREAREKQVPKKLILSSIKHKTIKKGDYRHVKCSCCESIIFSGFHFPPWDESQKKYKYCTTCGQKLKWED